MQITVRSHWVLRFFGFEPFDDAVVTQPLSLWVRCMWGKVSGGSRSHQQAALNIDKILEAREILMAADLLPLADAIAAVDPFGALHVVVDDGNVEDHHIENALTDPKILPHEAAIARKLLTLCEEDREQVLQLADQLFARSFT